MTTPQLVPALGERSLLEAAHRLAPKPTGAADLRVPGRGDGPARARLAEVSGAEIVLRQPGTDLDRDGDGLAGRR